MYLDNAASTKVAPSVYNKLQNIIKYYGNPSSMHEEGFLAKEIINEATDIISKKLNCEPEEIYYTSGATMSNNIAIQGFLRSHPDTLFVTTRVEHEDILMLANWIKTDVKYVEVDSMGLVKIDNLESILINNTHSSILCSIQMANSETGVYQNIKAISDLIHKFPNAYLHTDATQYIPYYPIDVKKIGIDMLSMSGQKINCIKGTGLLYVNKSISLTPIIFGSQGLVGGTENTLGIGCLGEAFRILDYDTISVELKRDYLMSKLNGQLIGSRVQRLPNNICVYFEGIFGEDLVMMMSNEHMCISSGSACMSGNSEPSKTIKAMGFSDEIAKGCVRFTLNDEIKYKELDYVADVVNQTVRFMKG